ncbi:MAG: dUTP diphosphatase [Candidatus Eisenbacteria bacterium]|uniref:dUTP diphosphatase n=1 Tax=Eiseniibacteriota bacterium TaxID=2212470 RepID=A0A538U960_UNCEI|nr:MAG: dUTP diphosphatase [Candidatus Eisenbacteria bacterium]
MSLELRSAVADRVRVRIQRLPHATDLPLPGYASAGAAGLDVRAAVAAPVEIPSGGIAHIPTGLVVEIPAGFEFQIRPRSGLATRHGLTLPNAPATIDSDYRGEIVVALIAQMVLARVPDVEWDEADALSPTARSTGGFGHTGI